MVYEKLGMALLVGLLFFAGCGPVSSIPVSSIPVTPSPSPSPSPLAATSTQPPLPSSTPRPSFKYWFDPALPDKLAGLWSFPKGSQKVDSPSAVDVRWGISPEKSGSRWVFALVAPFPTVRDGVSLAEVLSAWNGKTGGPFGDSPLIMSERTLNAFVSQWGKPDGMQRLRLAKNEGDVLRAAWEDRPSWAIVPFEALEPRWKVLQVNAISPLDKNFDGTKYPLTVYFKMGGSEAALAELALVNRTTLQALQPPANLDEKNLTRVIMTGVTALVRATAARMERKGVTYPGQDISAWLKSGDIVHISNEISFNPQCPFPDAIDPRLVFCSNPKYIGLLESVGANLIDMTGNHLNDYGAKYTTYTIDMYRQRGWKFFAAGNNIDEAKKPAIIESKGNKFAFIGCNVPGPVHVWATEKMAGVARCDFGRMADEIKNLAKQGFLPVVTLQYYEYYYPKPNAEMQQDFKQLSAAGAVIVSGSQAHRPAAFAFQDGNFIHFGLGNLFFDQMETDYTGTRQEFIDRHIFYNGRHISTELLTAMLEDWARPRPMTSAERIELLTEIFQASGW